MLTQAEALAESERHLASLAEGLRQEVVFLAQEIGERNLAHYAALQRAAAHIDSRWRAAGFTPRWQEFAAAGRVFANLEIALPGRTRPREIVVLGAHYDSAPGSPGADDNASGVAALLLLARRFAGQPLARTLRLVAFSNEEQPFTCTRHMGSRVYARAARDRHEHIHAMVCLQSLGCRYTEAGSQRFALGGLLLPRQGDFIALVGNWRYRRLLAPACEDFRTRSAVDCVPLALPRPLPGACSGDHGSFWHEGFPAFMLTDTAPLRYPYYHSADDTPDKLDFIFLAQVLPGIAGVVCGLATPVA